MIRLLTFFSILLFLQTSEIKGQINAQMLRFPDVSEDKIVFTYAGDLWLVSKTGGVANRLSSPSGQEAFAKFSPDGKSIGYTANYNGSSNLHVISTAGGAPRTITHHGMHDRMTDWHPDGKSILFSSSRESGKQRWRQFYKVSETGGLPEKLPLVHAEFGSFSPDGGKIAFTQKSRVFRTWKRYRGGTAADIHIFDLNTMESKNITNNDANDELPMWSGDKIYFLSDAGPHKRFNLWRHDITSGRNKQITNFENIDVHFPSIGPSDIVFSAGSKMYLYNLKTGKYNEVPVTVLTDEIAVQPKLKNVKNLMRHATISPNGKRVVVEARGELFSIPAEHGYVKNLTQTSGSAERHPSWSPDGRYLAFWTDRTGEYELALTDMQNGEKTTVQTKFGPGFRYQIFWSPDSKKLAFAEQNMKINIFTLSSKSKIVVDQGNYLFEGSLRNFRANWSPDSRYLTFSRSIANGSNAIFIHDTKNGKNQQITSGYYNDNSPVFDPTGQYLYFTSNRSFEPIYSDFENTFTYPNATQIVALCLSKKTTSPLAPRNDEANEEKEEEKDEKDKKDEDDEEKKPEPTEIDFDNLESRMVVLPIKPGNFGRINAIEGKVIFHRAPSSGSLEEKRPLKYFDLKEREEKTISEDVDFYTITAENEHILAGKKGELYVIKAEADQKLEKPLRTSEMEALINPREEWKQIFTDAWRLERDFFYDPDMHGLDWNAIRDHYGKMLEDAATRSDVNFVLGEMIGELNASHTYRYGGDLERSERKPIGYLGIDWEVSEGYYRIKKIIRPANWETEVRSPLDRPGINAAEGDYIFSVNGRPISINDDPWAAFIGLAGKTVQLKTGKSANESSATTLIVKCLESERRLRNLAWIEANRKLVDEKTNGKIAYIYVPSTGLDGQEELVRMFYGQANKQGVIVDERWNNGGQIPDRFIELLNRKPLAFWKVRDGKNWQWPPSAIFGPKVMLANGWSGSGGDAFPDYFKKAEVGKLIGTRTWGGLIGISGAPSLIDGGGVTVPTFRMYDPDGKWFREGYGVEPDIEVKEDPSALAKGTDPQLERAIEEVLKELETYQPIVSPPPVENRN